MKQRLSANSFFRLIAFVRPYKKLFFVALFAVITLSVLGPLRPYLIGKAVDQFIVKEQNASKLMLALLGHAHDFISFASLAAVLWMGLRHLLVRNGYTPRRARSPACPSVSLSLFPHQRRQ